MVTDVTNLSRSGLSDWLIQRVSALLLAAYTLYIVGNLIIVFNIEYPKTLTLEQVKEIDKILTA